MYHSSSPDSRRAGTSVTRRLGKILLYLLVDLVLGFIIAYGALLLFRGQTGRPISTQDVLLAWAIASVTLLVGILLEMRGEKPSAGK